jgi:hypothetical protein
VHSHRRGKEKKRNLQDGVGDDERRGRKEGRREGNEEFIRMILITTPYWSSHMLLAVPVLLLPFLYQNIIIRIIRPA